MRYLTTAVSHCSGCPALQKSAGSELWAGGRGQGAEGGGGRGGGGWGGRG